jgi:hypothetical protein
MLLSVDCHLFTDVSWQPIGPNFKVLEPEDLLLDQKVLSLDTFQSPALRKPE